MVVRPSLVVVALLAAAPASAEPAARPPVHAASIRRTVDAELARMAAAEAAEPAFFAQAAGPRRRNWVQRHPVRTAAIAGFLSGFAIGWAAGDDAVFDDFTGEFNGLLLGGICAGSAASVVAIVQAMRR